MNSMNMHPRPPNQRFSNGPVRSLEISAVTPISYLIELLIFICNINCDKGSF